MNNLSPKFEKKKSQVKNYSDNIHKVPESRRKQLKSVSSVKKMDKIDTISEFE